MFPMSPTPPPPDAATADLRWPAPHHMRWAMAREPDEPERAVVTMSDGDKRKGALLAIDFGRQWLSFQPDEGSAQELAFSGIRSVLLSRPVELERIPLAAPGGALAMKPTRNRHMCTVRMADGEEMQAVVVALLPRESGLFLYVVHYGDTVLRWFMPAHAVAHYRLGDHMRALPMAASAPAAASAPDFLDAYALESREAVDDKLQRQKEEPRQRLGELLVDAGLITPAQRDQALVLQGPERREALGEILVKTGAVSHETIRRVMVSQLGVPAVRLNRFPLDPNAVKAISPELARKHLVMPLYREGQRLVVAIENPLSWQALRELEVYTGLRIEPCLAPRAELISAVDQFYGDQVTEKIGQLVARLGEEGGSPAGAVEEVVGDSDNTLVRLVNKMITDAYDQGASDIHIESGVGDRPTHVRFRSDGELAPYIEVPPNFRSALVSRIKIMSGMDIAEHRRPQDGKIAFEEYGPRRVELRVVTMPIVGGREDVVMRLLTAPRTLTLEQLGVAPRELEGMKAIANRSFGLLFVCGPTGSGKTTTLHALLGSINTPVRKIWTVEDPVEITQEGLRQVQVNPKLGLTFPAVLRSFLRADPDVIMVGETRDQETARTVIAASLTGHLVLSTMHTNSAVESIVRLLDFGLDAFNFSDALLGVVGQRLVRRLCHCKQAYVPDAEELDVLAHEYCRETGHDPQDVLARWRLRYGSGDGTITLYRPRGCATCDNSGYKGRMGVYELLTATPAIKEAIRNRENSGEVLRRGVEDGMTTLEQDAIEKIFQGYLDFKQVLVSCR
jgi:type II secretory ATPase GspE/PulE/Tfp pilus assembly ATPase PilB-like protein